MMADIGLSSRIVFVPQFLKIEDEWILLNAAKRKALVKKYIKPGFLEGGNIDIWQQKRKLLKKQQRKKLLKRKDS